MRRFTALLAVLGILVSMGTVLAAPEEHFYVPGSFSDVQESAWYGVEKQGVVRGVVESGLMDGMGDGRFGIGEVLTLGQAVAMAVRVHAGDAPVEMQSASPWYAPYVRYARENGLLEGELAETEDFDRPAARWEVASLFAASRPVGELPDINVVEAVPDVAADAPYGGAVYLLYRAGVLTGDDDGSFRPLQPIVREEAAAILLRIAEPARRQLREPLPAPGSEADAPGVRPDTDFRWSDYREGMEVVGIEAWDEVATAAYFALADSYVVKLSDIPFDFNRLTAYMYDFYNMSTFYCSYTEQTGLLSVRCSYSLFDLLNGAVHGADPALLSREAAELLSQLDAILAECLTEDMTETETARAIHDYMVLHYEYDEVPGLHGGEEAWSFAGLLKNGCGVCQAYMELYYLLCRRAGLECGIVTGSAFGGYSWESHGWNTLTIDGETLYVDVTFDDPVGAGEDYITHDYFLVGEETLAADHSW